MRRPTYQALRDVDALVASKRPIVSDGPQTIEATEPEIVITFLTPERFFTKKEDGGQVGIRIQQDRRSLLRWLTWPTFGRKEDAGAWSPCDLPAGIVLDGAGSVSMFVGDVDLCTEGALDRSAAALAPYLGAVVPSFHAKADHPKHRIILFLDRSLTAEEWPIAWRKMASDIGAAGIVLDPACKNINRLWFPPVAPSPAAWLGARLLTGDPVQVDAMLNAARAEEEDRARERAKRLPPRPVQEQHKDKYIAAAMDRERENIRGAGEGGRHDALLRACWALARFDDLTEDAIRDALLETFVAAAGEARRSEGLRAVRDAVDARKRSA